MITIINRSNADIFYRINDIEFDLEVNVPVVKTKEEYDKLLESYGCFLRPRIGTVFEVMETGDDEKEGKKKKKEEKKKEEKRKRENRHSKTRVS